MPYEKSISIRKMISPLVEVDYGGGIKLVRYAKERNIE